MHFGPLHSFDNRGNFIIKLLTKSVFDSHVSNISYDSKTPHINIQLLKLPRHRIRIYIEIEERRELTLTNPNIHVEDRSIVCVVIS